ncbi:hypothetical protein ACL02T_08865 [Pseudonocardia sp. RS010]|uniref:hypothetical protein n=1 Tax=Pseudonocardia sp. RS010 TaxID=3385979 RepID=UPI0039A0B5A6
MSTRSPTAQDPPVEPAGVDDTDPVLDALYGDEADLDPAVDAALLTASAAAPGTDTPEPSIDPRGDEDMPRTDSVDRPAAPVGVTRDARR